jgi:F-type H+-transporting ATPase subunit epsilon
MSETFSIKLVTPSKVFLETSASLVTVPATEGDMGFLANHVSFISAVKPGFISIVFENGDEKSVYINEGFVQFIDNNLLIIAVELTEKENISSNFIDTKINELESLLIDDVSNIKIQGQIESLKSLSI